MKRRADQSELAFKHHHLVGHDFRDGDAAVRAIHREGQRLPVRRQVDGGRPLAHAHGQRDVAHRVEILDPLHVDVPALRLEVDEVHHEALLLLLAVDRNLHGRRRLYFHQRLGQQAVEQLEAFRLKCDATIFPEVVTVSDFDRELAVILQSYSIGPIKPNIVLLGWPQDPNRFAPYFSHLRTIIDLGKSVVVYLDPQPDHATQPRRIDIWWKGQRNGSLMVILAHLLILNPDWRRARLRLLRQVPEAKEVAAAEQEMHHMLQEARIKGTVKVAVSTESFQTVLDAQSADADLVMLGLNRVGESIQEAFFANTEALRQKMPAIMLVYSNGEADLMA